MRFERLLQCLLLIVLPFRRRIFIVPLIFTTFLFIAYLYISYTGELRQQFSIIKQPKPLKVNNSLPIILLWTKYFSGEWIHEDGFRTDCLENRCQLVTSRAYLSDADYVAFHWKDVQLSDLPNVKYKDQKWILYNMESPANMEYLRSTLEALQDSIDWTMSYRLDSDVTTVYGYTKKRNERLKRSKVKERKKEIAWMVSNCNTPGKREDFAKVLSQYLNIDIYGHCGKLTCARDKYYECLKMVEDNYKFYLSFENSICTDYVTEKLFRIMAYDVIPIVFGGANYTRILPPNSFIDALSFSSARTLADHVNQVSRNYTRFSSYFDWKRDYDVVSSIGYDLCFLCDKIVNDSNKKNSETNKPSRDLVKWWYTDANCKSWK